MTDTKQVEELLRSRLAELTGRAEAIEEDLRHPLDADSSEQAIDLADDEALAGIDDVIRQEIHEIREALLRIERDEYGTCVSCGADINPERLKALPTATRCIKCA
ncbi:MAG: TraR/DksA family transcriptional regulator [Novosphingobium sp.]|nr:TraR/DksA family transcriptional regulator [Novosphingobium sp.]MCP5401394.1 TraR/DksA family transcriptional regulator [Novosphingobium sp.]